MKDKPGGFFSPPGFNCKMSGSALRDPIDDVEQQFSLSNNQLRRISNLMQKEMEKVLKTPSTGSSLKMLVTHIKEIPAVAETGGCFLGLDLGGTNFRLMLVRIKENGGSDLPMQMHLISDVYTLPERVLSEAEYFFDHIAKCMSSFCKLNGVNESVDPIPVAFTFSFPLHQEHLGHAVLIDWAKEFDVNGVVGNNIVAMLTSSLQKRGDVNCEIVAVVNDTVATLVSCAYNDPSCKIGLIVGNGCNACYMEEASNLPGTSETNGEMCINMEWGLFGDNGDLDEYRNDYDREVDTNSKNPSARLYEKMICGNYLGELVRVILCRLVSRGIIFNGKSSDKLSTPGSFFTSFVHQVLTNIHSNVSNPLLIIKNILVSLEIFADESDCMIVRQVCHLVSTRAAYLCAAGVAAIALKIRANQLDQGHLEITVAVDGTLYKKHPSFSNLLKMKVEELCSGNGVQVNFMPSYGGSGRGAALVAAAARQYNRCGGKAASIYLR